MTRKSFGGNLLFVLIFLAVPGLLFAFSQGYLFLGPEPQPLPIHISSPLPDINSPPLQENLARPLAFRLGEFDVNAVASFSLTARVLAVRENGNGDAAMFISPVDLGLGWGGMATVVAMSSVHFQQSMRFLQFQGSPPPGMDWNQVGNSLSHAHIIPANRKVRRQVKGLSPSDVVTLGGYLVNVTRPDGWHWETSMTREDKGDGACEVFYVQYVIKH